MSFRPVGSSSSSATSSTASKAQAGPSQPAAAASTPTSAAGSSSYYGAGPVYPAAAGPSAPSASANYGPQIPVASTSAAGGYDATSAGAYPYDASAYGSYAGTSYDYSQAAGTSYDYSQAASYPGYAAASGSASYASAYPAAVGGSFEATDEELLAQASAYDSGAVHKEVTSKAQKGQARRTVLRKGAGDVWEDQSLMEWDPAHFRLFIGDLGNDVNEDDLVKAFGPEKGWQSFVKAKVVRDKVTNKTRGYGFVSYSDPEDFMKGETHVYAIPWEA